MKDGRLVLFALSVVFFSCFHSAQAKRTVEEVRIATREDDAEEASSGLVYLDGTQLELVWNESNQNVGLRFNNVEIPQGASILSAYIQFEAREKSSTNEATLTFRGEAVENAPTFSASEQNLSSRLKTPSSVIWSPAPWKKGEAGSAQRSPDLSPVLQEIIDQKGWTPGNALAVFLTGKGKRVAQSYDGASAAAALLHIEYDNSISINSFEVDPAVTQPDRAVTFRWSAAEADGEALSCSLDVDSDGVIEYTNDCKGERQTHVYPRAGRYKASFSAVAATGAAKTASATVEVTTPDSVVVAAAGDIACSEDAEDFNGGLGNADACHMLQTSNLILALQPAAVLALGDLKYGRSFEASYGITWGRFKNITYPVPGNHEYGTADAATYFDYFGSAAGDRQKGYYSFGLGKWHVIALNSNCAEVGGCAAGSPQEVWLEEDLATHPNKCTLVYWHHPRFSSGDHGNDAEFEDFWKALYEAGAELVLVGHDHDYERFAPQTASGDLEPERGIREFVVGTGGKDLRNMGKSEKNSEVGRSDTYGILKLTLHPESYVWEFVADQEQTFTDEGMGTCH